MCGNLIVSKGSLYVYLFELNLRNLLYVTNIMGYYHINDTGKGVIIKDFDKISKDYKMPPIDYIKEYFESKREIGKKNLEWLASMDVYHQLAYLALNDYRLSYIVSNLNEKTPEAFCKKYDESYSDDFSSDAANIFECLFCYRFGYPFGYFKGISDYDGTIMFFCNANILIKLIIRNLEN